MSRDRHSRSRREVLRLGAGLGAGLAFAGLPSAVALALDAVVASGPLITRPIPSSGERIPVVGIGTARCFGVGASAAQRSPLRDVLESLPRFGGRLVDTAPSYGNAEAVLGELIEGIGHRDELFIATKVGAGRDGRAAGLAEMEASLARLRVSHVDLMQIHNLSGINEMLPVLKQWQEEGKTRYVGMSTSFKNQYDDFQRVMARERLDVIQVDYAIDNRDAEQRILPLAAERGMAVLVNLPFGRGRVFQRFGDRDIPGWAREYDIHTWAQFALKFVVSHPAVTCAIPGTATMRYLRDNIGAAHGRLPDARTRERMAALIEAG
jgi:aryl-alcohol dehydrogenase-like predicted oxidoreductase